MKLYKTEKLGLKWFDVTGHDLRSFVDFIPFEHYVEVLPNMMKLEQWLKPDENESIKDALKRKYGDCPVRIIEELLTK